MATILKTGKAQQAASQESQNPVTLRLSLSLAAEHTIKLAVYCALALVNPSGSTRIHRQC